MSKKQGLRKIEFHEDVAPDEAVNSVDHSALLNLIFHLSQHNRELHASYDRLLAQTAGALIKTLELKDAYTYGHSMRVTQYALMTGREAGLTQRDMLALERAALFHDVGKVGVADCVLLKPGRLTTEEQKAMQEHPRLSAEILELIDEFKIAVPAVLHHHERFDGKGYPAQLSGYNIPVPSRIILVGDTFDAMTSDRPYRKALTVEHAYSELRAYAGTQFDPEFVKAFIQAHHRLLLEGTDKAMIRVLKAA